jgi:hypothetical protein
MATFSISMSVEVEAADYDEACDIRDDLFRKLQEHPEIMSGPYEIDVEQTSDLEDEE